MTAEGVPEPGDVRGAGLAVDLRGRVALVTGASRGLGRAIAEALAASGASLALAARSAEDLARAAEGLGQSAAPVEIFPADITAVANVRQLVRAVLGRYGRIDILVNSAGTNIPKPALDVEEADWDAVVDLNLKALFFCCQAVGRHMVERRYGRIINISSEMGHVGFYDRAAYCASKGGVTLLTKVLAIEWAPYGVTVNAVSPTFVETSLTRPMLADPRFREEVLRRIPAGRLARPEEVAAAVLFLASDQAAMVTGHSLLVDGGWVAW
jgi:2-deoxy-D-gluconate 3-dehydrogenase